MFKNMLIPVDDSRLSAANVTPAVKLARDLGARVTFFHAASDFSATEHGALLKSIAPAWFARAAVGDTDALLAKASSEATALAVPFETACRVTDRPAQAILEAARSRGSDLIAMASHGSRNSLRWLHSSLTEHVLQSTGIPLLVTRFEATEPLTDCDRALAIIQDEHRAMAVVIWGLLDRVERTHQPADPTELAGLELMLGYLQSFPLQQHHPKEERYLHPRLRQRAPKCEPLLAEIEGEHDQHKSRFGDVCRLLREASSMQTPVAEVLVTTLKVFAEDAWRHIRHEEMAVLPLARARLLESDWIEIAEVFEGHGDPALPDQAADQFRLQFARIANRSAPVRALARSIGQPAQSAPWRPNSRSRCIASTPTC